MRTNGLVRSQIDLATSRFIVPPRSAGPKRAHFTFPHASHLPPQAHAAGHTAVPFPTLPDGPAKPDGSARPDFDQDTSANGD